MLNAQATFCGSDTTSDVGAQFVKFRLNALELVGSAFAGEFDVAQRHRAGGRRRAVAPQRVDRIVVDRHQFGAGRGAGLAQFLGALGGVQPWIVAELGAALEILFEPLVRRRVHQMLDGEEFRIDLRRRLHGVAAVHEQRGALGQHDGGAGRAGEAGEPGKPLLARRQIFVLLAVGARHHKAVKPAPLEFGAQWGEARRRRRRFARIVEGLETGLEHRAHSSALPGRSNAGMRAAPGKACASRF